MRVDQLIDRLQEIPDQFAEIKVKTQYGRSYTIIGVDEKYDSSDISLEVV
jgi:hypothetical protein